MKYSTPQLYGQIKTHKNGNPIRPVVAYYTHPAYLTAKYLALVYHSFRIHFALHHQELICASQHSERPEVPANARLLGFDAKNLFTNVPVANTIELMVGPPPKE